MRKLEDVLTNADSGTVLLDSLRCIPNCLGLKPFSLGMAASACSSAACSLIHMVPANYQRSGTAIYGTKQYFTNANSNHAFMLAAFSRMLSNVNEAKDAN